MMFMHAMHTASDMTWGFFLGFAMSVALAAILSVILYMQEKQTHHTLYVVEHDGMRHVNRMDASACQRNRLALADVNVKAVCIGD